MTSPSPEPEPGGVGPAVSRFSVTPRPHSDPREAAEAFDAAHRMDPGALGKLSDDEWEAYKQARGLYIARSTQMADRSTRLHRCSAPAPDDVD